MKDDQMKRHLEARQRIWKAIENGQDVRQWKGNRGSNEYRQQLGRAKRWLEQQQEAS